MRINKYVALATGMSRRKADELLAQGRVGLNGQPVQVGQQASEDDTVTLNGKTLKLPLKTQTVLMDKPVGYVCSRRGQGNQTIYELLPSQYHHLKPVGRLDKDSSGLLVLTNDGQLANRLTHPKFSKQKLYQIRLDRPLKPADQQQIIDGVRLHDGISQLGLKNIGGTHNLWQISMHEGRNRQIRRTFEALGYSVIALRRTQLADYTLASLNDAIFKPL